MRTHLRDFVRFFALKSSEFKIVSLGRVGLLSIVTLLTAANQATTLGAQTPNRITKVVEASRILALPNHHPLWANDANDAGALPADQSLNQFTMVLARSADQEQAFEQLLADQQNPASPNYHHWLTPAEIGDRFGLSGADIATITSWLESQGLHVNWVSPSRIFIGFGGAAADVGHAFQTEMHAYKVHGEERISVASDPMIPEALAPAIKSIRGLYTIPEKPSNQIEVHEANAPDATTSNGNHYIAPADFATIYDVPYGYTGTGYTIGIVSWSRTNTADFTAFASRTGTGVVAPTEVVPTAYGGIDPGAAYTTTQTCTNGCLGAQTEATLDVLRSNSIAPEAKLLLVVSSPSGSNDGIGADAQYIVQTSPVPAQIMSISFGACESAAGSGGVAFWNQLFQQAAAEGISTFVSSGDSGASGCDAAFSAPPANPAAISPNYICTSSYATCVGGTEFNDTANASAYWSTSNLNNLGSALGYIPEGGWNESTTTSVAGSGGGVSLINTPTPSWQTGTGVPSARAGRYTPDIAFSSSDHDSYFGCMAAAGGSCVGTSSFSFIGFYGTSAAAPSMAGIAALLDQKTGAAQGTLNPTLYSLATSTPSAFHDTTVASSGVSSCSASTASMCNNSVPSGNGGATQAGYLVGTGYDEVTGLGSLDVGVFLNSYTIGPTIKVLATPPSLTFSTEFVGYSQTATLVLQNSGNAALNSLSFTIGGTNPGDFSQNGGCQVSLQPNSSCTMLVTFQPTAAGMRTASMIISSTNATNSPVTMPLTGTGSTTPMTPNVFFIQDQNSIASAQTITVSFKAFPPSPEYPIPTGSIRATSGSYSSAAIPLVLGAGSIAIPGSSLTIGTNVITVVYTPDSASSAIYASVSNVALVTVVAKLTPTIQMTLGSSSITTAQPLQVTIIVNGGNGNAVPTGSVILTSGSYSSGATTLSGGNAIINIAAGILPIGADTLVPTYTPDSASSALYNGATGFGVVTVSAPLPPTFAISGTAVTVAAGATTGNASTITVLPANGFTGSVALTAQLTSFPPAALICQRSALAQRPP